MKYYNTYQAAKAAYPDADAVLATTKENSNGVGLYVSCYLMNGYYRPCDSVTKSYLRAGEAGNRYWEICNPSDYEEDMNIDDVETKLQPKTVVEYEKVEFEHAWEAVKYWDEGGELFVENPLVSETKFLIAEFSSLRFPQKLYRRIERPARWYETCKFPVLCHRSNNGVLAIQEVFRDIDDAEDDAGYRYRLSNLTPLTRAEIQTFLDNAVE